MIDLYIVFTFVEDWIVDCEIGLPLCLLPMRTLGTFKNGASIKHDDEFPTKVSEFFTKLKYSSRPAESISKDFSLFLKIYLSMESFIIFEYLSELDFVNIM